MHRRSGAGRLALSGLKPGRSIFTSYHGTEDLYHERPFAAQGASSSWAEVTPTLDTYMEELDSAEIDIVPSGPMNGIPVTLTKLS